VQHSGSDGEAVRGLLEGRQRLPGMETLPDRLLDLQAVTAALETGKLSFGPSSAPQRFVLAGHSLGGLSDLLWAGAELQPGLDQRCQRALRSIPVLDSSFLLQCQLTAIPLAPPSPPPQLDGVMVLNGFGSLLWANQGLRPLTLPVLMVGGSLDLITPPATEQLEPFRQLQNSNSRLALVEGASHFSPVRLEREQPLMQFGEDLVGKDPLQVQALLLELQSRFLASLEAGTPPPVGKYVEGKVRAFVLDRSLVNRLHF
jgi:predicted dienelactone hydrolase